MNRTWLLRGGRVQPKKNQLEAEEIKRFESAFVHDDSEKPCPCGGKPKKLKDLKDTMKCRNDCNNNYRRYVIFNTSIHQVISLFPFWISKFHFAPTTLSAQLI